MRINRETKKNILYYFTKLSKIMTNESAVAILAKKYSFQRNSINKVVGIKNHNTHSLTWEPKQIYTDLKVDYDNQKCWRCGGELERPKRTNKPVCALCQKRAEVTRNHSRCG
jgi:uncharacterized protein with PIN domain